MTTQIISLASIKVKEGRQRKIFSETEMYELKESILGNNGLLQPILVQPAEEEGTYYVVAGERRFRTLQSITQPYIFGNEKVQPGFVPAVIKNFSDDIDEVEAELHENIVRVNLTWEEKAKAISKLHELKTQRDPRHTKGMTARLIDTGSTESDYASSNAYRTVQESLLVKDFLDDPDVKKARTIKEAKKIVTRKIEEENIRKLYEYSQQQAAKAKEVKETLPEKENFDLEIVPPAVKVHEKKGVFYQGDVMEQMGNIQDGSINLVITDPPYGINVQSFKGSDNHGLKHDYEEENFDELHQFMVRELDRVCAENSHVYIFCDVIYFETLKGYFSDAWSVRRKPLIWDKENVGKLMDGMPKGFSSTYEIILHATRGDRVYSQLHSDIISMRPPMKKVHAAQKPVGLYKFLMEMSGFPGDTVLDPFAGSGTIFRAAYQLMMNPIGIELHEKYGKVCQLLADGKNFDKLLGE